MLIKGLTTKSKGFAIIEILIAITILSTALLTVITGVSTGIVAISGNRNFTIAMIIAKSKLSEFQITLKGSDITDEAVEDYPGFTFSREVTRYEHELLGPLDAKIVKITVNWEERGNKKSYDLSYIYPEKFR